MIELIENIGKLHTTEMGIERIKRNLQIETNDIVQWCRVRILEEDTEIERLGKNWEKRQGIILINYVMKKDG